MPDLLALELWRPVVGWWPDNIAVPVPKLVEYRRFLFRRNMLTMDFAE
jgi:hypothetical protein